MKQVKQTLALGTALLLLLCSAFFSKVSAQCTPSGTQVFWTNTTLTGTQIFNKAVYTIQAFTTVTINGADCQFYDGVVINIEQGGQLLIKNNAVLHAYCAGHKWGGINVIGDPSLSPVPGTQGYVEVINSEVRDAVRFVRAYEGGLVKANNSTFKNNTISLQIEDHLQNYPFPVLNCDFSWDYMDATNELIHINLDKVINFAVQGCSFKNTSATVFDGSQYAVVRGTGIKHNASTLSVTGSGTIVNNPCPTVSSGRRTTFESLGYGIRYNNTNTILSSEADIGLSDFKNNFYGINITGNSKLALHDNTFLFQQNTTKISTSNIYNQLSTDVYVESSSRASDIYRNEFNWNLDGVGYKAGPLHIFYYLTWFDINIKKNNFASNLANSLGGAVSIFEHKSTSANAAFYCNTFANYANDLQMIISSTSNIQQIGSATTPANNIFSRSALPTMNIIAGKQGAPSYTLNYYMENPLVNVLKEPLNNTNVTVLNANNGATYSCTRCNNGTGVEFASKGGKVTGDQDIRGNNWTLSMNLDETNVFTAQTVSTEATGTGSQLEVFDLSGRKVYGGQIENGSKLDLSSLKAGVYFYTITGADQQESGKLMIK